LFPPYAFMVWCLTKHRDNFALLQQCRQPECTVPSRCLIVSTNCDHCRPRVAVPGASSTKMEGKVGEHLAPPPVLWQAWLRHQIIWILFHALQLITGGSKPGRKWMKYWGCAGCHRGGRSENDEHSNAEIFTSDNNRGLGRHLPNDVPNWLRHYATSRKVACSRPDVVNEFFRCT
jgi:hypothetical protein